MGKFIAKNTTPPLIEADTYIARCYAMIELGTSVQKNFNGDNEQQTRILIGWELPGELRDEGSDKERPFTKSKIYNFTMGKKSNLRKMVEGWRGEALSDDAARDFDLSVLLGKACLLSIIHKVSGKGNTYADISTISKVPKDLVDKVPSPMMSRIDFTFGEFDARTFDALPEYIQDEIRKSDEWTQLAKIPIGRDGIDAEINDNLKSDDLPF